MIVAEVVRSGYVEGHHHGSVIALRPDGTPVLEIGDLTRPVLPRSSNKPLQAVAMLEAGFAPASAEQLALACSSHNGEPEHLRVVLEILDDLGPAALGCPPAAPLDEKAWRAVLRDGGTETPLTMNCSGKHAAMLRTCVVNGWSTSDYLSPLHPLQQAIMAGLEGLTGERVEHIAVDGCGAPQHSLTLPGVARAFGAIATGTGAQAQVAGAMREKPWYVGGSGRDVTLLMEGIPGLIAKDGAEGVYAAALPDGSAVALKIDDGASRARTPLMVSALRALGVQAPVLDELAETPVLGGGRPVGSVRAVV